MSTTTLPVYRIAKWQQVFETSDSRRHARLNWVSLPVGFGSSGYQSLIDTFGEEAPAIYGAWCALIKLAAEQPWRGTLCSTKGESLTTSRISRLTFFPAEIFDKLIEWASSEPVGWLEVVDQTVINQFVTSQQTIDDQPPTGCEPVAKRSTEPNLTLPNLTGRNGTERNGTRADEKANDQQPVDDQSTTGQQPVDNQSATGSSEQLPILEIVAAGNSTIRDLAGRIVRSLAKSHTLSADDREDAYRFAALGSCYEALGGLCEDLLEDIRLRKKRGKKLVRPWGWFKTRFIAESKKKGLEFDAAWKAVSVPGVEAESEESR